MAHTITWKQHLRAIVLAFVLSGVIFWLVQYSSVLTADIAAGGVEFDESSDLVSYVEDGVVIVAAGKDLPAMDALSVLVFYNPEQVQFEADDLVSEYGINSSLDNEGSATLILEDLTDVNKQDELLRIRVVGDPYELTMSDIVANFAEGDDERLSISIQ